MNHLTSIRGLLALLIVLYHIKILLTPYVPSYLISIIGYGYFAVDYFFILSGFILTWKYESEFKKLGIRKYNSYIIARAARIFPLHITILTAYTSIPLILFATGRTIPDQFDGTQLLLSYLLIQNWGIVPQSPSWNLPAWSISVEMLIYIILPIFIFLITKIKEKIRLSSIILLTIILISSFNFIHKTESMGSLFLSFPSIHRAAIGFILGISAYYINKNFTRIHYGIWALFSIAVATSGLLIEGFQHQLSFLAIFGTFMMTLNFKGKIRDFLETGVLIYIGEISFSIYLTHYFVRDILKLLLLESPLAAPLWWIVLYISSTIILSTATYKYIEIPAKNKIRRIFFVHQNGK